MTRIKIASAKPIKNMKLAFKLHQITGASTRLIADRLSLGNTGFIFDAELYKLDHEEVAQTIERILDAFVYFDQEIFVIESTKVHEKTPHGERDVFLTERLTKKQLQNALIEEDYLQWEDDLRSEESDQLFTLDFYCFPSDFTDKFIVLLRDQLNYDDSFISRLMSSKEQTCFFSTVIFNNDKIAKKNFLLNFINKINELQLNITIYKHSGYNQILTSNDKESISPSQILNWLAENNTIFTSKEPFRPDDA